MLAFFALASLSLCASAASLASPWGCSRSLSMEEDRRRQSRDHTLIHFTDLMIHLRASRRLSVRLRSPAVKNEKGLGWHLRFLSPTQLDLRRVVEPRSTFILLSFEFAWFPSPLSSSSP
ncbi:hypothetical protein BDY24DRAFT_279624 [Mrakia frigida]|uniref:uncharacterized protein n=1 Tax=Mrakia frigida TaxID=29902 RepID=UPI003FCBF6FA